MGAYIRSNHVSVSLPGSGKSFSCSRAYGWDDILLLAMVYAAISITGIITLVMLAFKGVQMMNSQFIEHNEKRITGMILIIIGIVTFFLH